MTSTHRTYLDWTDSDNVDLITEELHRTEEEIRLLEVYRQTLVKTLNNHTKETNNEDLSDD